MTACRSLLTSQFLVSRKSLFESVHMRLGNALFCRRLPMVGMPSNLQSAMFQFVKERHFLGFDRIDQEEKQQQQQQEKLLLSYCIACRFGGWQTL